MNEVVDAFVVKMSEHDSYLLFDDAVKLILTNLNDYKDKIIERFVQSYINDKKIPMITIGQILHANEDTIALSRYGNSVYFRPNFLCNKDFIVEDICVLFHELEHCNTNLINSKKRFFSNEQYSSYAFTDNDDFLYFSSSDELKSRQAEIFYADKFYEQTLRIIYGESKYNTKENLEFLKSIKKQTTKKINEITKLYKLLYPYMRSISTRIRYKLEAKKNFKNIKLFFNKQELFNNEQSYQRVRNYINDKIFWLAGYISVYNDQKMLNKVLEFAKTPNNLLWIELDRFICSSTKKYDEHDLNRFFLEYHYGESDKHDASHFDPKVLARFSVLFKKNMHFKNQDIKNEYYKEKSNLYKKYITYGIPYIKTLNNKYKISIEGKMYSFNSLNELYINLLEYIDSSTLVDLNDEKIKRINSIFGCKVIEFLENTQELQKKKQPIWQSEIKDNVL